MFLDISLTPSVGKKRAPIGNYYRKNLLQGIPIYGKMTSYIGSIIPIYYRGQSIGIMDPYIGGFL
jgi:hypothetical protein